ncbi:hypothetical protein [Streptomyces boncukensis]|uniref:Uncharacterized protein n=1 Tax=Streptomyces boncukensis TaxID=2711219 RepID=A0A6G4WZ68_9ACTN|nr:hypothetical protein [Streptomyces boncukensis]NGO70535.1 hypothetical protein [Streptomyces boncukensis]
MLTAAVLYEREAGTSWDTLGSRMGNATGESVHERFIAEVKNWRRRLAQPQQEAEPEGCAEDGRAPDVVCEPMRAGELLDAWAVARGLGADSTDEHPITGHVPSPSAADELRALEAAIEHAGETRLARDVLAGLLERQATVLDEIAVEIDDPSAAARASDSRIRAAEIRQDESRP